MTLALMTESLTGRLVSRAALSAGQVGEMHALLDAHFEGVSLDVFGKDLAGKNWVVLLEDSGGAIQGFSTFLLYRTRFGGHSLSVIYSGDTLVDPRHWGSAVLPRTWIRSVNSLRTPGERLFWLLISSGCRTYRFLPLFWKDFHPRFDARAPADAQALLDHLATERFGHAYHPKEGVVRLAHPQVLREELLSIPPGKLEDPHIAFFARRNPGYVRGDELACLTELAEGNLTAAGRRMWGIRERKTDGLG